MILLTPSSAMLHDLSGHGYQLSVWKSRSWTKLDKRLEEALLGSALRVSSGGSGRWWPEEEWSSQISGTPMRSAK